MVNLACTWKHQERLDEAIQLLEDCVCRREAVFGADHPDTVSCASAVAEWRLEIEATR
ncbi:hypothetical protein CCHL11_05691 [Colletotrichum chlorophyti]|uniref:Uncharacterized protein n=1 Tax=Colletotrichum chlorophyti TaxID=708187 RepID=A0A1Q8RTZ2_9PEZI|nr:hypothetical protein CCHL11_05691 [Colletotrichum chlorophyti]